MRMTARRGIAAVALALAGVFAVGAGVVPTQAAVDRNTRAESASAGAAAEWRARAERRAEHRRILAFWTPERITQAIPRDFVRDPVTGRFRPAPRAIDEGAAEEGGGEAAATQDRAAPDAADGLSADPVPVAAAEEGSWEIRGTVPSTDRRGTALGTVGKVFFRLGGVQYVCTAGIVRDPVAGRSLVLTAAHCAFNERTGEFATNWMVVPDFDTAPALPSSGPDFCAQTSLGCWTATALLVDSAYASSGAFNADAVLHDFAFAVVEEGGLGGAEQLDAVAGAQRLSFAREEPASDAYLFGYPRATPFDGRDLVYSRGPLGLDPTNAERTYRVESGMTQGSSGGPWFTQFDARSGAGRQFSLTSYAYQNVAALHGPVLNANVEALFEAAQVATSNTVVPTVVP